MTRNYRLSLTAGLGTGFAVLAALLFMFHDQPRLVMSDLLPSFLIGAVGLAILAFSPLRKTDVAEVERRSFLEKLSGCGQRTSWLQLVGLIASGFFLGALLHKVIRLIA